MRTQTKYGVCRSELLDEVKKRNWFWFARKERCVIIESKIISCISNLNTETYVKVYSEHEPMAIPTARTLLEGRASVVVRTEQACATNFFLSFLFKQKKSAYFSSEFQKNIVGPGIRWKSTLHSAPEHAKRSEGTPAPLLPKTYRRLENVKPGKVL